MIHLIAELRLKAPCRLITDTNQGLLPKSDVFVGW